MRKSKGNVSFSKKIFMFIAVSLFLGLFTTSCTQQETKQEETSISVELYTVKTGEISTYSRFSAKAAPYREQMIIPKVSGEVKEMAVDIGSRVKQGDILFTIDDADIALQAQQAEAGYLSAQANYAKATGATSRQQVLSLETGVKSAQINADNAYLALERTKALYDMGAASSQALEQAQSAYDLALSQLDSAKENLELTRNQILSENEQAALAGLKQSEASYELARRQLENTVIRSDIDGVVGMNKISVGSMVGPTAAVMSVNDISKIYLEVSVSDRIINRIKAGDTEVVAQIAPLGDREFPGRVEVISPVADKTTLLYPLKIALDNPDEQIKPGMIASVKIITDTVKDAVYVPINSIVQKDGKNYVFVAGTDDTARRVEVETGLSNDDFVQITKGISAADRVVSKGQNLLEDGTKIEVAQE